MPDLIQFKRGPSSNLPAVKLKQGEPAFLYDTKTFVIGAGDANIPTIFINEQGVKDLNAALESRLQENINANASRISDLAVKDTGLESQIADINADVEDIHEQLSLMETEIDGKMDDRKIKASDLSTAVDADKVGLANLRQEVIAYINSSGGDGSGGGMSEIIPGSIGFDLLATEVNDALSNDFGSF